MKNRHQNNDRDRNQRYGARNEYASQRGRGRSEQYGQDRDYRDSNEETGYGSGRYASHPGQRGGYEQDSQNSERGRYEQMNDQGFRNPSYTGSYDTGYNNNSRYNAYTVGDSNHQSTSGYRGQSAEQSGDYYANAGRNQYGSSGMTNTGMGRGFGSNDYSSQAGYGSNQYGSQAGYGSQSGSQAGSQSDYGSYGHSNLSPWGARSNSSSSGYESTTDYGTSYGFPTGSNTPYDTDSRSRQSFGQNEQTRGRHFGKGPKGYKRSDERIKEEANQVLWRHHEIDASDIELECTDGTITLTGTVSERQMKRAAEMALENLEGVEDVRNELKVKRAEQEGNFGSNTGTTFGGFSSTTGVGRDAKNETGKTDSKSYDTKKDRGGKSSSDNMM